MDIAKNAHLGIPQVFRTHFGTHCMCTICFPFYATENYNHLNIKLSSIEASNKKACHFMQSNPTSDKRMILSLNPVG